MSPSNLKVDSTPTSQRLREGCWDLHQSAESGGFARRMIAGRLSRDAYVAMLQAFHAPMRALDRHLHAHRADVPAIDALVDEPQMQAPHIERDLAAFDTPVPDATVGRAGATLLELIDRFERENPTALLGLHYVREGANNGNRFVAMKLREPLGLAAGEGLAYLDPYANEQRPRWETFKTTFDSLEFSPEQTDAMVQAARAMFQAIIDVHLELEARFEGDD